MTVNSTTSFSGPHSPCRYMDPSLDSTRVLPILSCWQSHSLLLLFLFLPVTRSMSPDIVPKTPTPVNMRASRRFSLTVPDEDQDCPGRSCEDGKREDECGNSERPLSRGRSSSRSPNAEAGHRRQDGRSFTLFLFVLHSAMFTV